MPLFTIRNARLLPFAIVLPYAVFIALLLLPPIQRAAFYANFVNPTLWQDLSNVEQFGFHHAQVTPFTYHPSDDPAITLTAWHFLPLHLYLAHEITLSTYHAANNNASFPLSSATLTTSPAFHLLTSNPNSHLIISHHGNAAHAFSSHRPTTYQHLLSLSTPSRPIHVLTFDYRGFGLSTGSPTESGLIADSVALLQLLDDAGVDLARVTLLGQSLGTAVAVGAVHEWTVKQGKGNAPGELVLLAGFSDVVSLLERYSIKGLVPPLLSGLDYFPRWVKGWVLDHVADRWETSRRLVELWRGGVELDVSIMHAQDDWEIPWREGWENFRGIRETGLGVFGETGMKVKVEEEDWAFEKMDGVADKGRKRVSWEMVRHGGHNRVAVGEQMKALVLRSLDRRAAGE